MIATFRRVIALALLVSAPLAFGSEFPSKPSRIVVPYQPGGSTGASEQLGAVTVARSTPDGHTIMPATTIGLAIDPSLFSKLQYDPARS